MDGGSREKLCIRDSARSLKRYGSTNKHTVRENYIKHIITKGDTLQGIALRYGVTMEQIRRANRLWTSDSLFLREHLLIPETESNSISAKSDALNNFVPPSINTSENFENANELFGKIDAAIANTKEVVRKVQVNSEFSNNVNSLSENNPGSSKKGSCDSKNTCSTAAKMVVVSQDHKIRTSIKRHEWQQDQLFEL